jgi:hypothetical protein
MTFTRSIGNAALAALLGSCLHAAVFAAPPTPPPAPVAAAQPGEVMLYDGDPPNQAGITFAPWGNGDIQDSTDVSFSKGHALKIMTLDSYQGAKITFKTPTDLGDVMADKTRYISFVLRLTRYPRNLPPPAATTADQDPNNPTPALDNPPDATQPADAGQTPTSTTDLPVLHSLHIVFTLANGTQSDVQRPLPDSALGAAGLDRWMTLSIPLYALGFTAGTGGSPLQSITISGDDFAVMYIGQIKLIHDSTPITCFAGDQQTVTPDQVVTLQGTADGGASDLQFSWDFDAKDGVTDQAQGQTVIAQYASEGDYTVTLTVRDADGIKKPATSTTVIHVKAQ